MNDGVVASAIVVASLAFSLIFVPLIWYASNRLKNDYLQTLGKSFAVTFLVAPDIGIDHSDLLRAADSVLASLFFMEPSMLWVGGPPLLVTFALIWLIMVLAKKPSDRGIRQSD